MQKNPSENRVPPGVSDAAAPNDTVRGEEEDISDHHQNRKKPLNKNYNFVERQAVRMARHPCLHFWIALLSSLAVGVVGMIAGKFSVGADNDGWASRGTLIADRQTQMGLVHSFEAELHADKEGDVWLDLINNVQSGWESDDDDDNRRRLFGVVTNNEEDNARAHRKNMQSHNFRSVLANGQSLTIEQDQGHSLLPALSTEHIRLLSTLNTTNGTLLEGCDTSWYTSEDLYRATHLWPIWQTKDKATSFFDSDVLEELCLEEQKTQSFLEKQGLCRKCRSSERCLQPYSTVFYARLSVEDGMSMSCEELATQWKADGQDEMHKNSLESCVDELLANYNVDQDATNLPDSCPTGFFPTILDELYTSTDRVQYTSTIFATYTGSEQELYDGVDNYSRGQTKITGAFDTQDEDFVNYSLDEQLLIDMSLAIGSAFVTCIAMVVHTKSPFISIVGLVQVVLSFPLAYFFYTFVAQLDFFPFLNFIGIFVIFALGADDVFVAVDKWKNARLQYPDASVEEVAAVALPDAALSMFLTTLTTAVAFFGTAVCPVAPILCFAVFCGLLVVFDYIMCVLLVFPALCIYDQADQARRCCCRCKLLSTCCNRSSRQCHEEDDIGETEIGDETGSNRHGPNRSNSTSKTAEDEMEGSMVHKILRCFYTMLRKARWPLLVVCIAAFIWCSIVAAQIELPESSDVRLYSEDDNQYEQNFVWRQKLLFDVLDKKAGSEAYVIWGVLPADTGDVNNPDTWSQLVLDPTFQPSDTNAQEYLLGFCERFFSEDFATTTSDAYVCPMNAFHAWLQEQSALDSPSATYSEYCDGAQGLPMPEETFDACMYHWGQDTDEHSVLARDEKIQIMYVPFASRVRYDSPFDDLDDEWKSIQTWMDQDYHTVAPDSARNRYFTSEDFWWYDTNKSMLRTAFQSAGIALAAAAAVILVSSKSVVVTIFATLTIGYVLASVTAMLVAVGWELGFLESILFAILIGISCDFVIHFSHAYSNLKGSHPREERTLHALLTMGPSILAGAFTTFSAALVMLFTVIIFFEKFAVVLFLTVLQSLAGSFVVFLTMALCFGPSDPTYLVDQSWSMLCSLVNKRNNTVEQQQAERTVPQQNEQEPEQEQGSDHDVDDTGKNMVTAVSE